MIPRQIPLFVEKGIVIRNRNDATGVPDFLLTDPHFIPRDPQKRSGAGDGRVVVSGALRLRGVDDIGEVAGDKAAHGVVVGVFVGTEPFGEEVGFLVRGKGEIFLVGGGAAAVFVDGAVGGGRVGALVVGPAVAAYGLAVFEGEEVFFLGFEGFGEIDEERIDGGVEGDVEEDDEDQEDDHEDNGPSSCGRTEKTDQANGGKIHSHRGLLQCSGIYQTLGVDVRVIDEEQVVAVRKVDEVKADRGKPKDKRRNDRVRDR